MKASIHLPFVALCCRCSVCFCSTRDSKTRAVTSSCCLVVYLACRRVVTLSRTLSAVLGPLRTLTDALVSIRPLVPVCSAPLLARKSETM